VLNNNEVRLRQLNLHLKGMLDSIEPDLINHLDQNGEWINAARGTHIIREGALAGDIYLAISGRLQIVAGKGENKRIVGDIPPGELIGEMAFFTGEPRSADVYALRDSVLLKLKKPVFDELIARHPALMNAIVCQLIKRLSKSVEADTMSRHLKTIAIIPASKETPVKDVTRQIVDIRKDLPDTGRGACCCCCRA
jgi:NTE family protein